MSEKDEKSEARLRLLKDQQSSVPSKVQELAEALRALAVDLETRGPTWSNNPIPALRQAADDLDALKAENKRINDLYVVTRGALSETCDEFDRLREAVEAAPHDQHCPKASATAWVTRDFPCNCWRGEALTIGEAE